LSWAFHDPEQKDSSFPGPNGSIDYLGGIFHCLMTPSEEPLNTVFSAKVEPLALQRENIGDK
jgi:hypothetical protein